MKTFTCQICGYIAFDQAPVDCPVCNSAIENFDNNPDAIETPADADNLSETEGTHIPQILVRRECGFNHGEECREIQVSVGEIEHVMESEHFINFIDFYINRQYMTRIILTPKNNHPVCTLHTKLSKGTLSVIANCNVHGNWRSKIRLDEMLTQEKQ